MLIEREEIEKAKQKLGDENAKIIAELLELDDFDEKNLKACCPYHKEDTPSFIYDKSRYRFHCFGCNKNVDILDVLMEKGYTFLDAAKFLFDKAGIAYSFGEQNVKTRQKYRYPHEEPLGDRTKVIEYFNKRGISKSTLDYLDVREDASGNAVFNYYDTNDVLTMVKYRPARTITKEERTPKTWCQKDADTTPLLFNMNRVNPTKPLLVAEGECFKGDVEILTPKGWVRFDEYDGQQVLQVNEDLTGTFVEPIARVQKEYSGDMYTYERGGNFNLTTTPNHNWVYVDYKGNIRKRKICEFPKSSLSGNIPTTITVDSGGIPLSNDWIALWLAVSADGALRYYEDYAHCRISLKKQRKIERLEGILKRLNIDYVKTIELSRQDRYYFGFRVPKYFTKELPNSWLGEATLQQRKFILNEMVYWDGNHVHNRNQVEYSSKLYHNATWMQTMAHTCGYMSTIMHRHNKHGEWYKVSILFDKKSVSYEGSHLSASHYDGQVYCVTVPSGMILVRQNGHITVCGNCDAMSAIESGYLNAVSVPLGAQNLHWIEENWDWLDQFPEIIIWADNDEAGEKMRKDCIYRLGTWRTKYVVTPQYYELGGRQIPIKDINECLQMGGKQYVLDLLSNAQDVPVTSVVDYADITQIDVSDMDGIKTGIKELDQELIKIFDGTLTLLSGRPGSGKTSFIDQVVAECIDNGNSVFMFSRELPAAMSTNWMNFILAGRRNISQMAKDGDSFYVVPYSKQAEIQEYYRGKLLIYKDDEPNDVESILKSAEECVRKYGVKFVVLDNLMMIDLKCSENERNQAQTDFINELIHFAVKFNVAVVLCLHPHKLPDSNSDIGIYDLSGSSNIINLAMRSIGLRRVTRQEKEDPRNKWSKYDVVLSIIKDRMLGKSDFQMGLWYDNVSRRFYTNYDEYDKQYSWDMNKYTNEIEYVDRLHPSIEDFFPDQ